MFYNQGKIEWCFFMTNIIRFRTREEWEEEKKEKMLAEWEAYLAWEEETLRRRTKEEKRATLDTNSDIKL